MDASLGCAHVLYHTGRDIGAAKWGYTLSFFRPRGPAARANRALCLEEARSARCRWLEPGAERLEVGLEIDDLIVAGAGIAIPGGREGDDLG
jgi:hypothetical protein